jgi:hypothetical protein
MRSRARDGHGGDRAGGRWDRRHSAPNFDQDTTQFDEPQAGATDLLRKRNAQHARLPQRLVELGVDAVL